MTPSEGRGLLRGGVILLVLSLIRLGLGHTGVGEDLLPDEPSELSSLLEASRDEKADADLRSAPLLPGERLDPNRCPEEDFDRLPGIGPATAKALVAHREENGGYRGSQDLLRVPGIGPAKLAKMAPHLDFTQGVPLELLRISSRRADTRGGEERARRDRIDLNRASSEELESLPGIGPALAGRVIESRSREGPFHTLDDLLRVRGIGPVVLSRIRNLVQPGG